MGAWRWKSAWLWGAWENHNGPRKPNAKQSPAALPPLTISPCSKLQGTLELAACQSTLVHALPKPLSLPCSLCFAMPSSSSRHRGAQSRDAHDGPQPCVASQAHMPACLHARPTQPQVAGQARPGQTKPISAMCSEHSLQQHVSFCSTGRVLCGQALWAAVRGSRRAGVVLCCAAAAAAAAAAATPTTSTNSAGGSCCCVCCGAAAVRMIPTVACVCLCLAGPGQGACLG